MAKAKKQKQLTLSVVWNFRLKLWAEANGLRAKADGLRAKANGLWAEADGLWAKADGLRAKANGLWAEADGLRAEADGLWAEAILGTFGNIKLEWKYIKDDRFDCILENGEHYKG